MSKPINVKKSEGCVQTSSSCIIWQGNDIDCIGVCENDSLDEVIHSIGCLTCTINDQIDVDTYDLTCFNLDSCDIPHTFRELMQFQLEMICQLQDAYLNGTDSSGDSSSISGQVSVASCFQSNGVTMTLEDYVSAIGVKVCEQEVLINNQKNAITQLLARVEVLEG